MLDYLDTAVVNACRQLLGGFGIVFVLAFIMGMMSQKRRVMGSGFLGKSYYYFVAPGVMFHELGHAIGCILTLTKVVEFAPFRIQGETLGHVRYVKSGRLQSVRECIIATGPVWFGCVVIFLLGLLMEGKEFLPVYSEAFPEGEPSFLGYLGGMFSAALGMFTSMLSNWNWLSPTYLLLLYLLFCITSEITLSSTDLAGMWRGFSPIVFFVILINLIPGVHVLSVKLTGLLAPTMFFIHSTLLLVLFIDIAFYVVFKMLVRIFCGRRKRS
jgi:hypothetical protein